MTRPTLKIELPFTTGAARTARRLLREQVAEACSDVELIVSELVTNAVMHGAGPIELVVRAEPGVVRVEVCDGSAQQPVMPTEQTRRPGGGRGLSIVAALTSNWGWHLNPPGKCVWATYTTTSN